MIGTMPASAFASPVPYWQCSRHFHPGSREGSQDAPPGDFSWLAPLPEDHDRAHMATPLPRQGEGCHLHTPGDPVEALNPECAMGGPLLLEPCAQRASLRGQRCAILGGHRKESRPF